MELDSEGISLSEATFRFDLRKSSMQNLQLDFPLIYVLNIPWEISIRVKPTAKSNGEYELYFCLRCCRNTGSHDWSCTVNSLICIFGDRDYIGDTCSLNETFHENTSHHCYVKFSKNASNYYQANLLDFSISITSATDISFPTNVAAIGGPNVNSEDDSLLSTNIPSLYAHNWILSNFSTYPWDSKSFKVTSFFHSDSLHLNQWELNISLDEEYIKLDLSVCERSIRKNNIAFKMKPKLKDTVNEKMAKEIDFIAYITLKYADEKKAKFTKPLRVSRNLVHQRNLKWGWKIFKKDEIIGSIDNTDDILEVNCIVKVYRHERATIKPTQPAKLGHLLEIFLNDELGTDTLLETSEGNLLHAHKAILEERSRVFAAMFQSEMKERKENQVKIPDITFRTLKLLKDFLYANFLPDVSETDYIRLLYAADKYELPDLMLIVETELIKHLTENNAIDLLILGDTHNAARLKRAAMRLVCFEKPYTFCKSKTWDLMVANHPHIFDECFKFVSQAKFQVEMNDSQEITPSYINITPLLIKKYYFSNVTLVSKDKEEIKANMTILAANSSFFRSEIDANIENKIFFNNVDIATLELLVKYAYEGFLPLQYTFEQSLKLLDASCEYEFPNLTALIAPYIVINLGILDAKTAVKLLLLSKHCHTTKMKEHIIMFICWGAKEAIFDSPEWISMRESHPHLVVECFRALSIPQCHQPFCDNFYFPHVTRNVC